MLLTEKQAREKWCPMARVIKSNGAAELVAGNQDSEFHALGSCFASDCMMWRWRPQLSGKEGFEDKGWCGLAGKSA